jgi:general secretion pathway protein E/type IV pilus assembly protein PilB
MQSPPKRLHGAIVSRLKIMSRTMSIAEKRLPQDGRIQVRVGEKSVDLRVSTIPTVHGESVVMRILDKTSLMLGLPDLGFLSDDQAKFEQCINLPDGIILVTGPTGSGKTTTLYGCLNYMNKPDRKLITVEDPVEYQMNGINQVPVNASIGMTFPAALRSILRQAPNIIMIGEIRDNETASIAVNASLTGHLVLSTLHTQNASQSIGRILDFFRPDEREQVRRQLANTLKAVVCQRMIQTVNGGITPSLEILINTPTVRKMLEENRLEKIGAAIETGRDDGMQTFNQALYDLVKARKVTEAEALAKASNPQALDMMFKGIFLDEGRRSLS